MVPMIIPNAGASDLHAVRPPRPKRNVDSVCRRTHALGYAAAHQMGYADVIVSGGTRSVMSPVGMAGFQI